MVPSCCISDTFSFTLCYQQYDIIERIGTVSCTHHEKRKSAGSFKKYNKDKLYFILKDKIKGLNATYCPPSPIFLPHYI